MNFFAGCSSFQFYIKPQPITASSLFIPVVPHSNSTSNHNFHLQFRGKLFVVPHSNSTSNHNVLRRFRSFLLVVPHSNSTSNHNMVARLWKLTALFLIPILHQTTTFFMKSRSSVSCSSFQFYIKPQPFPGSRLVALVVPHSNSTSNHNQRPDSSPYCLLFLIPILHQTTTHLCSSLWCTTLFLIPILHQTTTSRMAVIHILHVTHMTPMHKTSCRTPGKLVGCNFVFQRAIYQKNSSC